MRRLYTLLLALLVTLCSAVVADAQEQSAPAQPQIVKKTLDNGVTVLVKPEKGSGIVAIVAVIRTGAAQETIQNAGIGNFVAQLLLAGTRLSSADEVASIADEVGGNMAAQWHSDFTEIRATTTSAMFNHAMRLIGESLTEANFEPQWVERVRADLLRNMNTESDNVFDRAYDQLRDLLYQDNGYRRPEIGFERTIKLATPQDLQDFYAKYYVPNNIVISVAGDITVEQAVERAEMAFAGIPAKQLPRNRGVPDETLDRSKFVASEADLPAAYLMLGWLAPGATSPDYPAVSVAVNALGGGKGSILFRELRLKRGIGYPLGAMYPLLRYQSHVVAYVVTDPFKIQMPGLSPRLILDDVKNAVLEQVSTLKNTPLSDKDLQRAKGYTIGTYALSQQHLLDRAFQIGWLEAAGLGYEMYWKYADAVEKVSAADVQRVAKKYFGDYSAVLLLPKPGGAAAK